MVDITQINSQNITSQKYSLQDENLIQSVDLIKQFGKPTDYIEYHVYSIDNALLHSDYSTLNYRYFNQSQVTPNNTVSNISLNPTQNIISSGYNKGSINITYNILRNIFLSDINSKYYIKSISSNRTELRVSNLNLNNSQLESIYDSYISQTESSTYYRDFSLNFGNNNLLIGINLDIDKTTPVYSLLIKLYEPLPPNIILKDTFWVNERLSDPVSYNIEFNEYVPEVETINFLKGPNFNIGLSNKTNISTPYTNYNDIFSTNVTTSLQQFKSLIDEKGIDINVDYSDYSNFIHFSSVYERINNFKYKLGLIESYKIQIGALSLTTSGSTQISSSKVILEDKINEIIKKFDGYEYYLYFESGSKTWPKSNNYQPYIQYPSTSSIATTWLGIQLTSASLYDENNFNNLIYTIPEKIRNDVQNQPYEVFLNMIGQHFDNIWIYEKAIKDIHDSNNNVSMGVSKDLVSTALKSLGAHLYANSYSDSDVFSYFLGVNTSGSYVPAISPVETLITSSLSLSSQDIESEVYKRIYHNLPLLYKSKGTERGLRALISCFGIPNTILNISEFGGSDKNSGSIEYSQDRFSYALSVSQDPPVNYISIPWDYSYKHEISSSGCNIVPDTLEFRFKANSVFPSHYTQSLLSVSSGSGFENEANYYKFGVSLTYDTENSKIYNINSTSSYSSSISSSNGRIKLWMYDSNSALPTSSNEIELPCFNGDWWNIMVKRETGSLQYTTPNTELSNKYWIYVQNKIGNQIGFQGSASIEINSLDIKAADYNKAWMIGESTASLGGTKVDPIIGNNVLFDGNVQEFRYWTTPLSKTAFNYHTLNPSSIEGNNISSSYSDLMFRIPIGNDLDTNNTVYLTSVHPYITGSFPSTASFWVNNSEILNKAILQDANNMFVPISESYYYNSPNTGINKNVNDKIRINTQTVISGSTLSPFVSILSNDKDYTQDVHNLEVAFSPQNEINKDIISQLGYFNIDEYIGDPRELSLSSYSELKTLQNEYFKKYTSKYNYFDYIRLIKYFDNSLFKMVKDYVPGRANVSTGIVIKPNILERNKQAVYQPTFTNVQYTSSIEIGTYSGDSGGIYPDTIVNNFTHSINTPLGKVTIHNSNNECYYTGELPYISNNYSRNSLIARDSIKIDIPQGFGITTKQLEFDGSDSSLAIYYDIPYVFNNNETYYLDFEFETGGGEQSAQLFSYGVGTVYYFNDTLPGLSTISVKGVQVVNPTSSTLRFTYTDVFKSNLNVKNIRIYKKESTQGTSIPSNNIQLNRKSYIYQDVDYTQGITLPVNWDLILQNQAYKAEVQDSNYTSKRVINSRYLGSKLYSTLYNKYTAGDSSYGNSAVIDVYSKYFAKFYWVGNGSPEVINAGNFRIVEVIDQQGNIVSFDSDEDKIWLLSNIFKAGTKPTIYFRGDKDDLSAYYSFVSGSTIIDPCAMYDTALYLSGSNGLSQLDIVENLIPISNPNPIWSISGSNQFKFNYSQIYDWVNKTYESNELINKTDIYSYTNASMTKFIEPGTSIWSGSNEEGGFQFNQSYFPLNRYDFIRIVPSGNPSDEGNLYYEQKQITSKATSSLAYNLVSPFTGILPNSGTVTGSYSLRLIKKIITPDFIVSTLTAPVSIQNEGLIVPENYDPSLDYISLAKKAEII